MHFLQFWLLYPLLRVLSIMPMRCLYLLSDLLFYLLYYFPGYRRKIVRTNLRNSLIYKEDEEILSIEKKFYRNFSDILFECIKMLSFSKKDIISRCYFATGSYEVFKKLFDKGKHVIIAMGHTGNWEFAGLSMSAMEHYIVQVIYRPLANTYYDKLMFTVRSRFGAVPLDATKVQRVIMEKKDKPTVTAFITDQSPPPESAQWLSFLYQDTPVYKGIEKISRKLNYPVVFANVRRVKRGYYEIYIELICENPGKMADGEITKIHTCYLEEAIREQPDNWLWTHRRWKHRRITN